jgi:hypothetical protein
MDTNQLMEGIGAAVAATKPAQEYCFLWIDWWPMCMTKSEWSGWMQAVFSVLAILAAVLVASRQRRLALVDAHEKEVSLMRACLQAVVDARAALKDVERKITGESDRPPSSSRARIESLERTFQILLTKDIPQEAVKPLLIVLREIAYTKRAIDESSHRAFDPDGERARKAESRTKVVMLVARALKKELNFQVSKGAGFLTRSRPDVNARPTDLNLLR